MKTAIFLTDRQIRLILSAINQINEYTTEYDDLVGLLNKKGVEEVE